MLSLLALAYFAQSQPLTGRVVSPGGYSIQGEGIACAIVEAETRNLLWSSEIDLDADGHFRLHVDTVQQRLSSRVKTRPLEVWIRRDALHRELQEPWEGCAYVALPQGIPTDNLDLGSFVLGSAPVTVSGTVLDSTGVPQSGAEVCLGTAFRARNPTYPGPVQTLAKTICDEKGRFTFRELLPEDADFDFLALVVDEGAGHIRKDCLPGDLKVEMRVPATGDFQIQHYGLPDYAEAEIRLFASPSDRSRTQTLALSLGKMRTRTDRWTDIPEGEYEAVVYLRYGGLDSLNQSFHLDKVKIQANQMNSVLKNQVLDLRASERVSKLHLVDESGEAIDPLNHPAQLVLRGFVRGGFHELGSIDLLPQADGYLLFNEAIQRRLGPEASWSDGVVRIDGFEGVVWATLLEETTLNIRPTPWRKFEITHFPESVEPGMWQLSIKQVGVRPGMEHEPQLVMDAWPHPYLKLTVPGEYRLRWTRTWPGGRPSLLKERRIFDASSETQIAFPWELDSDEARTGKKWKYDMCLGISATSGFDPGAPASPHPRRDLRAIPIWRTLRHGYTPTYPAPPAPNTPSTPATPPVPTPPSPVPRLPIPPPVNGDGEEGRSEA